LRNAKIAKAHYKRSDICVVPAAGVIAEAMLAIVLADVCLKKFRGENLKETKVDHKDHLALYKF